MERQVAGCCYYLSTQTPKNSSMVENQPNLWLPRIALPAAEYSHSNRQYSVMICSQLGPAHVPHCKLHQTYLETDGADDGVECSYPNDANCDHDID